MFESCLEKQRLIVQQFQSCATADARYEKLITLGQSLPKLSAASKASSKLVNGCQSQMFLNSYLDHNKLVFETESDALISAGLAYLLVSVYSHERADAILKCPPDHLKQLQIDASLSASRSNGLYSLLAQMKKDAIKIITDTPSIDL